MPCVFSAFIGAAVAKTLSLKAEAFSIGLIPDFNYKMAAVVILLGMLCALVAGGFFVIALTLLIGSIDYNGSGMHLIEACFEGEVRYEAFLLKILFTAVTLEAGYKGGEIVPTLCIGATFGTAFAMLTGMPHGLMAACGMLAVFVGVTNCPISTLLIGFELFGYEAMPYFLIVIAVSFMLSGYHSLYVSQKFIYSKTKAEYINRKTSVGNKQPFE